MSTPKKQGERLRKKRGKKLRHPERSDRRPQPIIADKDDDGQARPWRNTLPATNVKRPSSEKKKVSSIRARTGRK